MKKMCIALLFVAPVVFATQQKELSFRLSKLDTFTASFDQIVTSPEGQVISKGKGTLAVKRPNLFKWETKTPDENLLISDGKTLWYFTPFIEQVTAMWLEDAISQTPFVLLTRNNEKDWENYDVKQIGDLFKLSPKGKDSQGVFILNVLKDGRLTEFSVIEQDGQKSRFKFKNVRNTPLKDLMFTFTVPKGVELDDQRQKK